MTPHIDINDFREIAGRLRRSFHENYYAMYSSVLGGIVTDPALMTIPMDDHLVHRGDGVFEVFKCVNGNIYNLKAHMSRLDCAARAVALRPPWSLEDIETRVIETVRAGGRENCCVHLYVSRGPGSFGVNPYECPEPQLYIVVTTLGVPFMDLRPEGARARTSSTVSKPAFYAGVKSCNYLPNVLMKKEAVDLCVDYVVSFDNRGFLAEGATENVGIVTRRGELLFPTLDCILAGTTMLRAIQLAAALVSSGDLKSARHADISRLDIGDAAEMLVVGTTPNIAAVVEFDGKAVGDGNPGPICGKLRALLDRDMRENKELLTPVFSNQKSSD